MSHADYIASFDEGQLQSLIEHANKKLKSIQESGYIKLWTVSVGYGNVGFFPQEDYNLAVQCGIAEVLAHATKSRTSGVELSVQLERYRPGEVQELLSFWKPRKSKSEIDSESDAERILFLMESIDAFANVPGDKHYFACEVAAKNGRTEPNSQDQLAGARILIDAARSTKSIPE